MEEVLKTILFYLMSFLLGFLWAFSELLSRYKVAKFILNSKNAWMYLLINGVASVTVYYFIPKLNMSFGVFTSSEWGKILLAGLSAMFILRSSFFSYHDKDTNKSINVGISTILQIFLDAAERSFDQEQSVNNLKNIAIVMQGVDFTKAEKDLSVLCLNLMQNVSTEEQKKLAESIKNLAEPKAVAHELTKSVTLGITLARITGIRLLKQAVETLGQNIKISEEKKQLFASLDDLESKIQ